MQPNQVLAAMRLSQLIAKGNGANVGMQIWLGQVAMIAREPFIVRRAIRSALSCTTQSRAQICRIAALQLFVGDLEGAYDTVSSAARRFPTSWLIWHLFGAVHMRRLDYIKAIDCFQRSVEFTLSPCARAKAFSALGNCYESSGHKSEAISCYWQAIDLAPDRTLPYDSLASCQKELDANSDYAERLTKVLRSASLDLQERRHLHYALGTLYDRSRQPAEAFAHFHLANDLRASQMPPLGFQEIRREVDARIGVFTPEFIANWSGYGGQDESMVFVVGMPRSGTTLVEQILDSHSDVCGLGEREDFQLCVIRSLQWELKSRKPYPWCLDYLTPDVIRRLSLTLAQGRRKAGGSSIRVVTKLPEDFWDLGLIAILFPKARIIHCRRHPIDTCLSCYMQNFLMVPYATSLDGLAEMYRLYQRIMEHWRKIIPSTSLLEIDYENLISHPEKMVRDLCDFCAIPFEPSCLRFHDSKRPVASASRWQVRQPIYRTSVNRWTAYREFLGPLLALETSPFNMPRGALS